MIHKFTDFCHSYKFIGFSFNSIYTVVNARNEVKKKTQHMIRWPQVNKDNWPSFITPGDSAFAIRTGLESNITVIDCDCISSYKLLVQDYPEFTDALTVKTAKGYHIYCLYDAMVPTSVESFKSYPKVDIRNDEGLVFAPPTQYQDVQTKVIHEYTLVANKQAIPQFPKALKLDLKCLLLQETGLSVATKLSTTTSASKMAAPAVSAPVTSVPVVSSLPVKALLQEQWDERLASEIRELLDALPLDYFEDWSKWFKIGSIIHNELGDNELACQLFLEYSRKSPKYSNVEWKDDIESVWNSYKKVTGKAASSKASLYGWCKFVSPVTFYKIHEKYCVFDFKLITTTNLAHFFVGICASDFIQTETELYHWNNGLHIWTKGRVARNKMLQMIGNDLFYDLQKIAMKQLQNNETILKATLISLTRIQDRRFKENLMRDILTELPIHTIEFDTNREQLNNLHFLDGVFMLNRVKRVNPTDTALDLSQAFRQRVRSDFVSETLPYSFTGDSVDQRKVEDIFKQIQPNQAERDFQLGWLAYCLTGHTGEQKFKMNIGYTAANGKSTEQKIHSACFPIYSHKLDKKTFNENNPKVHKQLIHLIEKPIRYAYIEELDCKRLDADLLKDVVDGDKINVEIMFGTSRSSSFQAKISTCSNKDFNIITDAGVSRRGRVQHYTSKFVEAPDIGKVNEFPLVKDCEKPFQENDAYKRAYLYLLLPYVESYYSNNGLMVPKFAEEQFKGIADEYDTFKNAIDELWEQGTDNDRVHKDDFMQDIREHLKNAKITWNTALRELKRLGIQYDRAKATVSKVHGKSSKGVITGLKKRV